MRITNNMIMGNTKTNINSTKVLVDKYNTQMTTQKKISKASEDPVIAIRSLRLSTSLSHLDQYKDNNIPDASSWMDVTQTVIIVTRYIVARKTIALFHLYAVVMLLSNIIPDQLTEKYDKCLYVYAVVHLNHIL